MAGICAIALVWACVPAAAQTIEVKTHIVATTAETRVGDARLWMELDTDQLGGGGWDRLERSCVDGRCVGYALRKHKVSNGWMFEYMVSFQDSDSAPIRRMTLQGSDQDAIAAAAAAIQLRIDGPEGQRLHPLSALR